MFVCASPSVLRQADAGCSLAESCVSRVVMRRATKRQLRGVNTLHISPRMRRPRCPHTFNFVDPSDATFGLKVPHTLHLTQCFDFILLTLKDKRDSREDVLNGHLISKQVGLRA